MTGSPDRVFEAYRRIRERLPISFVFIVQKADYVQISGQPDGDEQRIFEKLNNHFEVRSRKISSPELFSRF